VRAQSGAVRRSLALFNALQKPGIRKNHQLFGDIGRQLVPSEPGPANLIMVSDVFHDQTVFVWSRTKSWRRAPSLCKKQSSQ
jgi:hypothetical protein